MRNLSRSPISVMVSLRVRTETRTHKMRKHVLLVSALLAASIVGGAAYAAAGWRVVATGVDGGKVAAVTSAGARMLEPRQVAVRASGTGGNMKISWYLSCNGAAIVPPGTTIVVKVAAAKACMLNASGYTERGGSIRIQLLRR
jgi:hypothetical protein